MGYKDSIMSNQTVLSSDQKGIKRNNNSVNNSLSKTHCLVCNSLFTKPRVGKLYCSNRCKQFGYTHKNLINKNIISNNESVKIKRKRININEYFYYRDMIEKIKRFKELSKRNSRYEEEAAKLSMREDMGIPLNPESIILNNSYELKEEEVEELELLKDEVSIFANFELHNLSLEKWSFFRLLNPKFDKENLFKTVCQFSSEFINQLNFRALNPDETFELLGIKNKYIKHCNAINEGIIQFYDKIE